MIRKVFTAPMQVFSPVANGEFALEPYEAGWATEAVAMVYVHEAHGDSPRMDLRAQISVDGVRWIDFGQAFDPITGPGGYYLSLDRFGNWLRLAGEVSGGPPDGGAAFVADFYWVLK